ncbi:trk system potassium uptake protein TrkH [Hoeflea halophila]|uniref:Trk system potassium uptake protein TrkH n=1 Tax=Hoeflea halophila TaxID=714899 RepID=A0A286IFF1_9HYPH|nr:potassium transporter TrkG [Hoeflea halophila]SOE18757.1 trk system potassium uptake protein TrkH [Hoeflea halophila]
MLGILHVLAVAVAGLFTLLVPAVLFAIADGMRDMALSMLLVGSLGVFAALMVLGAIAGFARTLGRASGYVALVAMWVLLPMVAAASFKTLTGLSWIDAWFESVSALTTSGATLLSRETAPQAILFWRASIEWYGGFLTLLSIIHVLAPGGFGGLPAGDRRVITGSASNMTIDLRDFRRVLGQYVLITFVVFVGLMLSGVNGPYSAMLSMVVIATGGFLPFDGALENQAGPMAQLVLTFGLLLGTVSVFWRRRMLRTPKQLLTGNPEIALIFVVVVLVAMLYAVRLSTVSGGASLGPIFIEGLLASSSLIATSGIESRPGVIALLPDLVVLMIVLVGGGIYSTTGGFKLYRIAAMAVHSARELNQLIYPSSVTNLRFGRHLIDEKTMRAIWTYFSLSLLVVAFGALAFTLETAEFEGGITMAVAFFSNAGPVYEALIPPTYVTEPVNEVWPQFQAMPASGKIAAIIIMTLGRLEIMVVFAVLNVRYWMSR